MKTTVEISDSLLDRARQVAASRSTTLRELIEEGLRNVLDTKHREPFKLREGAYGKGGLLQPATWDEIRDEIYKGRGA